VPDKNNFKTKKKRNRKEIISSMMLVKSIIYG
jgi:hypothetical protein